MKGAYDHFMQKEIHEQPESLAQTLMGRIKPKKAARSMRSHSGSLSDSDCSDSGMSSNSDSPNNLLGTKVSAAHAAQGFSTWGRYALQHDLTQAAGCLMSRLSAARCCACTSANGG